MIDLSTDFGKHVAQRLKGEEVIWLTTVSPHGVAQPNPVWFYWDGEFFIIYSQPSSFRIRNIQHNPTVSLNLEGADVLGHNVVVIQGEAHLRHDCHQPNPGYREKYWKYLPQINFTEEYMVESYSVEITIQPIRLRGDL
jgi:PPOX class probable F420-dependent enzyme